MLFCYKAIHKLKREIRKLKNGLDGNDDKEHKK